MPLQLPQLFVLVRVEDVSGCSGTGIVADGVVFPDGRVALRWRPGRVGVSTTAVYDNIAAVVALHGHGGRTRVEYGCGGPAALPA